MAFKNPYLVRDKNASKLSYAGRVNAFCEQFKISEMSADQCSKCNVVGHKEGYYRTSGKSNQFKKSGTPHNTKNKNHKSKFSPQTNVVKINKISHVSRRKYVDVNIKILPLMNNDSGCDIKLQIDTASDVSMIGKSLWNKIGNPGMIFNNPYVTSASNNKI